MLEWEFRHEYPQQCWSFLDWRRQHATAMVVLVMTATATSGLRTALDRKLNLRDTNMIVDQLERANLKPVFRVHYYY